MSQKTKKLLKVVVDREKWIHGEGDFDSYLLRERDGHLCCLGFACLAAGLTTDQIKDQHAPHSIPDLVESKLPLLLQPTTIPEFYKKTNSKVCNSMVNLNDKKDVKAAYRERRLRELGRKVGIEFSFQGTDPARSV